jgi:hypothetical protein
MWASTLSAFGEDGGFQSFAKLVGEFVNFVGTVNLNCFARGIECHHAVFAATQVLFEVSPQRRRDRIVQQVIELR